MSFIKKLFQKPKVSQETSESGNRAFDQLNTTYTPSTQQGVGATNFLAGALGVPGGDQAGSQAGFQSFLGNAGYDEAIRQIGRTNVAGGAARGLLNSGITARGIGKDVVAARGTFFNNYLQQLAGLSGIGQDAGELIGKAGEYSESEGFKRGGSSAAGKIGSAIGAAAKIFGFSDRRIKTDIEKIDTLEDGLGIYKFRFINSTDVDVGVMAHEVAELRPWALGPEIGGMKTVDYEAL